MLLGIGTTVGWIFLWGPFRGPVAGQMFLNQISSRTTDLDCRALNGMIDELENMWMKAVVA
jgi:hypothetical protein